MSIAEKLQTLETGCEGSEKRASELEGECRRLEGEVKGLKAEEVRLIEEHEAIEVEREEELRALQNTLDDALEAKVKIQKKFEHDFELLRASCSQQEQQLMDDFEWKLRQIESSCKAKLNEKDKQVELQYNASAHI